MIPTDLLENLPISDATTILILEAFSLYKFWVQRFDNVKMIEQVAQIWSKPH